MENREEIREVAMKVATQVFNLIPLTSKTSVENTEEEAAHVFYNRKYMGRSEDNLIINHLSVDELACFMEDFYFQIDLLSEQNNIPND